MSHFSEINFPSETTPAVAEQNASRDSHERFCVAFCANGKMLPGLHATLASLLRSAAHPEKLKVVLVWSEMSPEELDELQKTVRQNRGFLRFIQAEPSRFKGLKPLQGDWMTYMRILLPELLPGEERIVYLDADLVVQIDVVMLATKSLMNKPLAAVGGGKVEWALERDFYLSIGLQESDASFNAGVLILDAVRWRTDEIAERLIAFGREHSASLASADQTLLNALFARNFQALPEQWNVGLSPDEVSNRLASEGIFHFVGSPKPWDLFGNVFHPYWKLWKNAVRETAFSCRNYRRRHFRDIVQRTWSIRRSYARTAFRKLRRWFGKVA